MMGNPFKQPISTQPSGERLSVTCDTCDEFLGETDPGYQFLLAHDLRDCVMELRGRIDELAASVFPDEPE